MLRWLRRRRARPRAGGCRGCGICCELYGHSLRASEGDLERWRAEGRYDLLLRVGEEGRLWVDPVSGDHLEDCPFLCRTGPESSRCRIHATKPSICRDYPTPVHGRRCLRGIRFGR